MNEDHKKAVHEEAARHWREQLAAGVPAEPGVLVSISNTPKKMEIRLQIPAPTFRVFNKGNSI